MSKRAKELAEAIGASMTVKARIEGTDIMGPRRAIVPVDVLEYWTALIDTELRKEREQCADRASDYFDLRLANEPICPTNWKIGLRAAILDDKEE